MSSLFVCHLRCQACGHAGPTLQWGRLPWEEIVLPASNLATRALDYVEITAPAEVTTTALVRLAREHSTEVLRVAVPSLAGHEWGLTPPLPCPQCSTLIEMALWGAGPSPAGKHASIDEIIRNTRSAREESHFTSPDEGYDVWCVPESHGPLLSWRVRLRDEHADLRAIVLEIVGRLKAGGSETLGVDIRMCNARFMERLAPEV